jgi:hypothetical protein
MKKRCGPGRRGCRLPVVKVHGSTGRVIFSKRSKDTPETKTYLQVVYRRAVESDYPDTVRNGHLQVVRLLYPMERDMTRLYRSLLIVEI